MGKIFGREPALFAALAAAIVQFAGLLLHWTATQQGLINAVVVGVLGLAVAVAVHDGVSAGILGLVQSVLSLALGFGLHLTVELQAAIMTLVAAVVAMFVRTQVTAKIAPVQRVTNPAGRIR